MKRRRKLLILARYLISEKKFEDQIEPEPGLTTKLCSKTFVFSVENSKRISTFLMKKTYFTVTFTTTVAFVHFLWLKLNKEDEKKYSTS